MKKVNIKSMKSIQEFIREIEEFVLNSKLDYIDAVLIYCEKNLIEVETVAEMIQKSSTIKAKIQEEAEKNNLLPKTSKLPI